MAAAIKGDVRISSAAAPKERKIARKQRIAWGHIVRTRKKSQLHILLLDRSNFTIGSSTQMVIDRFVYNPDENRSFFGRIIEGAFRFMSGRSTPNSTATIESPIGTIGIRGTAVDGIVGEEAADIARDEPFIGDDVDHDEDTATLVVLRGPGEATEGGLTPGLADVSAAGKTVQLVEPGLAAYIPRPGAQPIGPFRISISGLSQMQDELQPSVTRANKSSRWGRILGVAAIAVGAAVLLSDDDDDDGPPPTSDDNCHRNPDTGQTYCPQQ